MKKVGRSEIDVALGILKNNCGISSRTQWNFQVALNLRLQPADLHLPYLEPDPEIEFHVNGVNPGSLLRIELRELISPKQHQFLPFKRRVQIARSLVPLVKRCQAFRIEPLVLVVRPGLDGVVIDSDLSVGVSDGDVDGKVVLQSVVAGKSELRERGVRDVELDVGGAEYEPKDESSKANDDNKGDYELQKEAKEAAAAAPPATAMAVVGLGWWWDCRAVVGTVQVGLFLSHGELKESKRKWAVEFYTSII
jgi:hypothetical protein